MSEQPPDPKNVRDALLTAGYSPATVNFMLQAGEKHEWHEKDENDNEAYWATIKHEHGGTPYRRTNLIVLEKP